MRDASFVGILTGRPPPTKLAQCWLLPMTNYCMGSNQHCASLVGGGRPVNIPTKLASRMVSYQVIRKAHVNKANTSASSPHQSTLLRMLLSWAGKKRQEAASGPWQHSALISLIHISEPTRLRRISYAVVC